MTVTFKTIGLAAILAASAQSASAEQFVVKLESALENGSAALRENLKINEIERFESEGTSFLVLDAENEAYLEAYLLARSVTPLSISEVNFVNSPVVGGAEDASSVASDDLQTFVIERPYPRRGEFPIGAEGRDFSCFKRCNCADGRTGRVGSFLPNRYWDLLRLSCLG